MCPYWLGFSEIRGEIHVPADFQTAIAQSNSLMDVTKQKVTPQHMHLVVLCSDFICMQQGQWSMGLPLEGTVNSANIYDTAD